MVCLFKSFAAILGLAVTAVYPSDCQDLGLKDLTFGTIVQGSNHDLVTRRYLDFRGIADRTRIVFYTDFHDAADALKNKTLDFFVMNCIHPQASSIIGSNYRTIFNVDFFISPSYPLVVATRKDVASPQSIAVLYPSVANYTDTSKWPEVVKITTGTLGLIGADLVAGKYDSAIVYESFAVANSDVLEITEELGSPDDGWLVLGMNRTYTNSVLAWPSAPVTWQFNRQWF